ncbi:MAG: sigma-54 dependent transcriptional regulator [Planctomycetota bacterium]
MVVGPSERPPVVRGLEESGHETTVVTSIESALQVLAEETPDLVLLSEEKARPTLPPLECPVVVIGGAKGKSRCEDALGTIPEDTSGEIADILVGLAVEMRRLRLEVNELEQLTRGLHDGSALVGRSAAMRRLQSVLRRAADTETTVLIEGQPGTGKSLAARIIHCKSRRGNRGLVVCQASDLDADRMASAIEEASGSTLLIDDIEHLPPPAQSVLVRHLKERSSSEPASRLPRIIATSSARLPELIAKGSFREDLYYRLHVFPVVMPTLRERTEDIGLIANALLDQCARAAGRQSAGFTAAAMILLETIPWPGNVGQLAGAIQRAYALSGGGPIDRSHLIGPSTGLSRNGQVRAEEPTEEEEVTEEVIRPFEEEEQRLLGRALRATKGNVRRAAQLLGIGRATLYRKIQQFKLRLN